MAIAGGVAYQSFKPSSTATNTSQETQLTETTNENTTTSSEYKNGTYEAIGNYVSPGGPEEIDVTVTLENGVVTDATVVSKATRDISKMKQADFIANFKPMVIGKNVDEIALTKVSGSSLTPKGFNEALEEIKTQAKS